MSRAMLGTWREALVRALGGMPAGTWLPEEPLQSETNANYHTADEKRALRAGYNTVAQYEKAMAAKSKARRIHATTS